MRSGTAEAAERAGRPSDGLQQPVRLLLLLIALLVWNGCDSGGTGALTDEEEEPVDQIQETVLPDQFLQTVIATALQGSEVHLNNYGDRGEERDDSWLRSDDAWIRLGSELGGEEIRFTIAESRTSVGPWRLLYYVQDVNLLADSIAVQVAEDTTDILLNVILPLEEEGAEFKGHCLTTLLGGLRSCVGGSDATAPDVQLDEPAVVLTLQPAVLDSSLTLEAAELRLEGDVRAGGVCDLSGLGISFDVCDTIAGYRDNLRTQFESVALEALNQESVRRQIAAGLRPLLTAIGIGQIIELRRESSAVVVVHRPPVATPVDPGTTSPRRLSRR